jgi:two-component system cell cycle sensor histidine kinase/response regulator CckA
MGTGCYNRTLERGPTRGMAEDTKTASSHTLAELGEELAATRRALEIARESERRFRILNELTNDYCYVARKVGDTLVIDWLTGAFSRITGYEPEQLRAAGLWSIVLESDRARVEGELARVRGGETVVHEFRIRTQDGQERWLREHLRPECGSEGELVVYGAAREVTDRHRAKREQENLESQLRQSQKMEAIGRLAGGVAHDFNNLLTVILTHCGFLLGDLPPRTQQHDDASDIQAAARRAAELTQRLLAFSRQQVLTPTVIDLNTVLRDLESMLVSLLGEGIELEIMLHPGAVRLKADRAQLEQIVLNLVVNARDAMPHGGRLQILTAQVDLGPDYVRMHPEASEGKHTALGVRDTGLGMSEQVLARIFEPFYTTKEQGKGTGLGLSTVYGIVSQSGGSIHVESREGFGSTFEVFFPAVDELEKREPSARPAEARSARKETILVVEDEEGVRRGVQRILKHAGYQVLVAADPAQALSIVEDYAGHLDLLLTDVIMPMMTGVQLAERVVAVRSDIKVLYMSGHAREGLDTAYKNRESFEFLQKPFSREAMLTKVAHVLDAE